MLFLHEITSEHIWLPVVPHAEDDTEQHVDDAENDGNLHLVRIVEIDLVESNLPHGVQAKWVWVLIIMLNLARVQDQLLVGNQGAFTAIEDVNISVTLKSFKCSL